MNENKDLIEALQLNVPSEDEKLDEARTLAMKYLRSKAPIPQTLIKKLERAVKG